MKLHQLITTSIAGIMALTSWCAQANDSAYPEKPVRLVVGFPPGQATDIIARLVAEKLAKRLEQPVIVENKPGAGGGLALAYLQKEKPDGYTISFANTGAVITNQFIQQNLPYNPNELKPIALLGDIPLVLAARSDSPFTNLEAFIEQARANPGRLTYATPGNGTTSHLAMESLKQATGIDVMHIPYNGSSRSLSDIVAGNVDVSFDTITTVQSFAETGRLKPLAIGTPERVKQLSQVPTLNEKGFRDIIGSVWVGAFVPKNTPDSITQKLSAELGAVMQDEELKKRLEVIGLYVRYEDADDFAKTLKNDTSTIKKVVDDAAITIN